MPTNELKRPYVMKAKLDVLKSLCEKYDIHQEDKKRKLKKAEYQDLIISELNKNYLVDGFTTNPSLMKISGAKNYKKYSLKILSVCKKKTYFF